MESDIATLRRLVAIRLVPLARTYRRAVDRALASLALSHSTALTVMVLARMGDGTRQGALAEELGMEGPSIVPLLDQVERAGLAERRADPSDKRAKTLHLTEAGQALAIDAERKSRAVRAQLFAGIEAEELRTTLRVLERLTDALGTAQGD